ncbi:MAG: CDP-alcohol phosphatidyltransferase family protein, partial [Chlorobi bacterium]|nr:CDP-alcohol phosphatidyltransferase family protein [Chlorobiota bacterium]
MEKEYSYEKASKTNSENDFLNLQSFLFVTSTQITKILFRTSITPHQVIFISMIFGITASYLIIQENKIIVIIGAVLLFYKNVLDKVDGSLARVKGLDSRRGRFYDSLADFVVTLTIYSAITYKLTLEYKNDFVFVIGFLAMVFSMLQCSFFIYYQVSFIKHSGKQTVNRVIESITKEDLKTQDKWTLFLQRVFMIIYGWQDILVKKLDGALYSKLNSKFKIQNSKLDKCWYQNKPFLTLASSLSIGTHIFLICITAIIDKFEYYLFMNLIFMNLLLIFAVIY